MFTAVKQEISNGNRGEKDDKYLNHPGKNLQKYANTFHVNGS
jgi:hypothetical protein